MSSNIDKEILSASEYLAELHFKNSQSEIDQDAAEFVQIATVQNKLNWLLRTRPGNYDLKYIDYSFFDSPFGERGFNLSYQCKVESRVFDVSLNSISLMFQRSFDNNDWIKVINGSSSPIVMWGRGSGMPIFLSPPESREMGDLYGLENFLGYWEIDPPEIPIRTTFPKRYVLQPSNLVISQTEGLF